MSSYIAVPQQLERRENGLSKVHSSRWSSCRKILLTVCLLTGIGFIVLLMLQGGNGVSNNSLRGDLNTQGMDDDYGTDENEDDGKSVITLITGTHLPPSKTLDGLASTQDPVCANLSSSLFEYWTAQKVRPYLDAQAAIQQILAKMKQDQLSCVVSSSSQYGSLLSFPVSSRPDVSEADCNHAWKSIRKAYSNQHRLNYDIFLFRPDLVSFSHMLNTAGVKFKLVSIIGYGLTRASLENEGCSIYSYVLGQHPVYKYSLIWKLLCDLEDQLDKIRDSLSRNVIVNCGEAEPAGIKPFAKLVGANDEKSLRKEICGEYEEPKADKIPHFTAFQHLKVFNNMQSPPVLPKTKTNGTKMVFVAGVEGVGHHLFSILGQGHFSEDLNRAMVNYLGTRVDATTKTFLGGEYGLENAIKHVKRSSRNKLLYLNTDEVVENMFSFPYGEHQCVFSRIGRSVCIPDLVDIARILEKSGVDLRIFVMERDFLLNLVSDSVHRDMDSPYAQAKVLLTSNAVLQTSLKAIDPSFYIKVKYEDMLSKPHAAAKAIAAHLGIGSTSDIYEHFVSVLRLSQKQHFHNYTAAMSLEHVLHSQFEERLWDYLVEMTEQFGS
jgi:hypothetical protein